MKTSTLLTLLQVTTVLAELRPELEAELKTDIEQECKPVPVAPEPAPCPLHESFARHHEGGRHGWYLRLPYMDEPSYALLNYIRCQHCAGATGNFVLALSDSAFDGAHIRLARSNINDTCYYLVYDDSRHPPWHAVLLECEGGATNRLYLCATGLMRIFDKVPSEIHVRLKHVP